MTDDTPRPVAGFGPTDGVNWHKVGQTVTLSRVKLPTVMTDRITIDGITYKPIQHPTLGRVWVGEATEDRPEAPASGPIPCGRPRLGLGREHHARMEGREMNEVELNAEIAALNDDLLRTATWLHNAEKERDEWRARFETETQIRREWAIRAEAAEAERDSLRDGIGKAMIFLESGNGGDAWSILDKLLAKGGES